MLSCLQSATIMLATHRTAWSSTSWIETFLLFINCRCSHLAILSPCLLVPSFLWTLKHLLCVSHVLIPCVGIPCEWVERFGVIREGTKRKRPCYITCWTTKQLHFPLYHWKFTEVEALTDVFGFNKCHRNFQAGLELVSDGRIQLGVLWLQLSDLRFFLSDSGVS